MFVKNKKPEIRFKEFSDDWEQRKFSETFTKISNNTLSRAELNYNSGLSKNIHYGDVLIKFGELLDVGKDELPYITDDFLSNKFKSSKLQIGDVIMADAAEDEMVGKCTELVNVGKEIVVSGLHTIPSRPTQFFASGYLGYFMNSPVYHNQLLRLMQGTKVLSISKTTLQDTAIYYPIDSEEQTQIGTFFKNLDHLLTLHQQKYNKLVTIKKAMLEKMFPKEGANVPEIRFRGFTEDWEGRKLGELVLIKSGWSPSNFCSGNALFIKVDDLNYSIREQDDSQMKVEDNLKFNIVKKGSIIFPKRGAAIMTNKVRILANDGYMDTNMMALEPIGINGDFLYLFISKIGLYKIADTSTIPQINNKHIEPYEILSPSKKEQEKIGNFFKNTDNFITLYKRELEKLKNLKKACLEKMFV